MSMFQPYLVLPSSDCAYDLCFPWLTDNARNATWGSRCYECGVVRYWLLPFIRRCLNPQWTYLVQMLERRREWPIYGAYGLVTLEQSRVGGVWTHVVYRTDAVELPGALWMAWVIYSQDVRSVLLTRRVSDQHQLEASKQVSGVVGHTHPKLSCSS